MNANYFRTLLIAALLGALSAVVGNAEGWSMSTSVTVAGLLGFIVVLARGVE